MSDEIIFKWLELERKLRGRGGSDRDFLDAMARRVRSELKRRSLHNQLVAVGAASELLEADLRDISFDKLLEIMNQLRTAIHGPDGRIEVSSVANNEVRRNSDGVGAVIRATDLKYRSGKWTLLAEKFAEAWTLCEGERFTEQPIAAICTAFLVKDDVVATAGHCIRNAADLAALRFLFGFEVGLDGEARIVFSDGEVFEADKLIAREEGEFDWALVRLRQPVKGRAPLRLRSSGKIGDRDAVYTIGHPVGLPKKYAPGAQVIENLAEGFFLANLDTFEGNSGSPVISETTHEVEGILVRGDADFVFTGRCWRALVCSDASCTGEAATRITKVSSIVSALD